VNRRLPQVFLMLLAAWPGLVLRADPVLPKTQEQLPIRPSQIERLKKDIIRYIYQAQMPDGTWEYGSAGKDTHAGGTCLCVYALLTAGESPDDPRLKRAIEWMKHAKVEGTYVAAARISACAHLPFSTVSQVVKADQLFLINGMIPLVDPATKQPNPAAGLYDYLSPPARDHFDHSVSQFAVLAMLLCEQMGLAAPRDYWQTVEAAWLRDQNSDGGWCYSNKGSPSTGSMTAAGVATLFITQDFVRLHSGAALRKNYTNEQIDRGIDWLSTHFTTEENPSALGDKNLAYRFYWLYALERVGIAGGLKYIGPHNWYDAGARTMAANDHKSGFVPAGGGDVPIHDAALALLFIVRGEKPVLVNKLRYEGDWNHLPRDAANITRWYGKRFETEFLWQVVRIDDDPHDFLDAPVLYLTGYTPLQFTPEQKNKLKTYIEDGGFLLINAQVENKPFVDSATDLLKELFPQYAPRPLPPNHPLVSANPLKTPMPVLGVSNGIRELAVILPQRDIPKAWQMSQEKHDPDAFAAAANIFFYASDRNRLRVRGESNLVIRDPATQAHQQAALARITYDGNWDPEPAGWRRMAAILHNQNEIDLAVETIPLGKLNLEGYRFAHLTGTGPVKLSPEDLAGIRKFLVAGGTLLVDAAGGSPQFLLSVEKDLDQLIPNLRLSPMTAEDPIFADTHPLPEPEPHIFPDDPIGPRQRPTGDHKLEVEYRRFARSNSTLATGLQLKGVRVGRRYAIILSPMDISEGLVGQNVDGVVGYTPATATEMVRRIIVNSLPKR
jgi:hypothetical protein